MARVQAQINFEKNIALACVQSTRHKQFGFVKRYPLQIGKMTDKAAMQASTIHIYCVLIHLMASQEDTYRNIKAVIYIGQKKKYRAKNLKAKI